MHRLLKFKLKIISLEPFHTEFRFYTPFILWISLLHGHLCKIFGIQTEYDSMVATRAKYMASWKLDYFDGLYISAYSADHDPKLISMFAIHSIPTQQNVSYSLTAVRRSQPTIKLSGTPTQVKRPTTEVVSAT